MNIEIYINVYFSLVFLKEDGCFCFFFGYSILNVFNLIFMYKIVIIIMSKNVKKNNE